MTNQGNVLTRRMLIKTSNQESMLIQLQDLNKMTALKY